MGSSDVLPLPASLAATLAGLRCDYATLVKVLLSAVRITGGLQINTTYSNQAGLVAAIAAGNAAAACPLPASRALLPVTLPASSRRLQSVATAPWATIAVSIGSSAAGALAVASAVRSAPATAFPLTTASWAPVWNFSVPVWTQVIGSPVALDDASLSVAFASGAPSSSSLSSQQQLGLGLGIGLSLLLFVLLALYCGCCCGSGAGACARMRGRAANQLHVVELKPAGAASTQPHAASAI